jgi:hypothetical protein
MTLHQGDALDFVLSGKRRPDLIATDPPYAFGGSGCEHELSATVAGVLREAAQSLKSGRWMLVMCAASWRSTYYMVDAVRGIVQPQRIATWCKPVAEDESADRRVEMGLGQRRGLPQGKGWRRSRRSGRA